jgi:uncharacterized membrane protein YhaH (DUF805 family)
MTDKRHRVSDAGQYRNIKCLKSPKCLPESAVTGQIHRRDLQGGHAAPLNPFLFPDDTFSVYRVRGHSACRIGMEDFFEFMFGASGRINRAKYWLSLFKLSIAGLLGAVVLFTAADLAAPLFVIMVIIVFVPWLLWGLAIHTERLHDRDKSAWWLMIFCLIPGVLGQLAAVAWFAGPAGPLLHYALALGGFALTIWGFVEIGCLRGTAGSNTYGPDPLVRAKRSG